MKKIIILLFLCFTCNNDSYNFYYEIKTDSPATLLDIIYKINSNYIQVNDARTPWTSDAETYENEYDYYLNIASSPENGRLNLYVNGALWESIQFYFGYDIEFKGMVDKSY